MGVTELRVKTRLSPEALQERIGKILSRDDVDVLLDGPARVYKPDGSLLAVYLPGALQETMLAHTYATLHELRKFETDNRGNASGTERKKSFAESTRTRSEPVASAIVGNMDPSGAYRYCRLTAWTGREWDKYAGLFPLFRAISVEFEREVPERYAAQMRVVAKTDPNWVIPDTAFSTITVNNSYPTGVHTDKGDLEEGFSTLAVLRRGSYYGGWLTFPEFRLAVDMKHGDVLLMDAHEYHGNTAMVCSVCGEKMGPPNPPDMHEQCTGIGFPTPPERISVVSYYRTKLESCGTPEEEVERARAQAEKRAGSVVDEMAEESAEVQV